MSTTEPEIDPNEPEAIRNLREQNRRLEERAAEAEAKARRADFLEAGIPLEDPVGKLFTESYKGEMDPDAIKSAWADLGYGGSSSPAPPPEPEPEPAPEGPTPSSLARDVGGDSAPPGAPSPPEETLEDSWKEYRDQLASGVSRQDAARVIIGKILTGAAGGDTQFVHDQDMWKAMVKENE